MLLDIAGGAQETRVVGGMQAVAEAMALGMDVRRSAPVRRIVQGEEEGVRVEADGVVVRAERAVVAVPLTLLGRIAFEPALSEGRTALVQAARMGAVIKCTAVYDEPFWRAAGLSGHSVSDQGPVQVTFDSSPPDGQPGVLV
ncbi:FAD-dependent oxidoreductase, partial [Bradyrhizobium sp. NBAIM08]|uniref:flavin monoamine oxidase family protein n=1 Tax=Bradyrhizobium sp. NBAIM08 TaxID=2793815 RepID=UPI001CD791F8